MTPRSRRTTWVLVAALVCLYVAGELLLSAAAGAPDEPLVVTIAFTTMTVVYLAVGGLVATRLPTNPVGWLLCGTGFFLGLTSVTYGYAALTLDPATGDGPAAGVAAAWITSWSWIPPLLGVPALLFLLFPDGRPIGPRWRSAVALVVVGLLLVLTGSALAAGGLANSPTPEADNPLGALPRGVADAVTTAGFVVSLAALVLGGCAVVLRLRRARGVERLQLKWLMWSAAPLPLYLAGGLARWVVDDSSGGWLAELVLVLCLVVVPLAVGAAILRYRLYDIDLVINRTLVYTTLTVLLAAAYLGLVLLLRFALDPLTTGSDLAVAGSTLAVAALFRPLRGRIQVLVDRRFYRDRYDAAHTLEQFASHLRDELDLETLQHDLRTVVLDTVHPTRVSLWLRGGTP
jgi:hypothetical protein